MMSEPAFYEGALRRIYWSMLWIVALGAAGIAAWQGWRLGVAFLFGGAAASLSFRWLHQVVSAMGPDARPAPRRVYAFFALRYLLLGAGGYVIVKVFGMNAIAALAGLFVPVAALLSEIVYELVHGT